MKKLMIFLAAATVLAAPAAAQPAQGHADHSAHQAAQPGQSQAQGQAGGHEQHRAPCCPRDSNGQLPQCCRTAQANGQRHDCCDTARQAQPTGHSGH